MNTRISITLKHGNNEVIKTNGSEHQAAAIDKEYVNDNDINKGERGSMEDMNHSD